MIGHPGRVFSQDFEYDPRFQWGGPNDIKLVSCVCSETIPPGVLVQFVPGTSGVVRVARDINQLVGVVTYDWRKYDSSVIFEQYDTIAVMRRGSVFVAYIGATAPNPLQAASFYPGAGAGQFSTDAVATPVPGGKISFSIASRDYYSNGDGSPAMDIPFPSPGPPLGITATTFGSGVALVEVSI